MAKKQEPKKEKEVELSEFVSNKIQQLQSQKNQIDKQIVDLVDVVIAEKIPDFVKGSKVRISQDFKKLIY